MDMIHQNRNISEIETFEHYGEKIHEMEESIPVETSQVLTVFNIMKMIHQMTNLLLKLSHQKRMGSKKLENRTNSLLPHFKSKLKNRKVEGLITYSTDQQIFKFKVYSWGVNIEFAFYELKCTIHAILQHMGFYHTTENPCVMMRVNHKTKS